MSLTPLEVLRFLLQFVVLLTTARVFGEIARRLKQPQVIGELLTGIVIGPSMLGTMFPALFKAVFPSGGNQGLLLQLIAQIGVILLLLLSGMETQVDVVRRHIKSSVVIAVSGILVSFGAGYGLASILPHSLAGDQGLRPEFLLFVATAMSMSAIPVIVKILMDMDLMRHEIGQLTLAIGIITDTIGWFLLSFVTGMATHHMMGESLLYSIFGTIAFALFCFTLGHRLIRILLVWMNKHVGGESPDLSAVMLFGLLGATVTQFMRVEAFLGAFLAGVQMARIPTLTSKAHAQLRAMTLAIFSPLFFATAGLRVDLHQLFSPNVFVFMLAAIAIATVSKFFGTYIGARLAHMTHWLAIGLGAGLNARGAVEIIVASIGLQMGILSTSMYSIIVIMAVATSMMAPPLLRWALRHYQYGPEPNGVLEEP